MSIPVYNTRLLRHLRRTIGQNILHYRHKRHITLTRLSRDTGIPEVLLDHYELGKNEITLDELLKIACSLKTEAHHLMKSHASM